jgi:hypothetical protein
VFVVMEALVVTEEGARGKLISRDFVPCIRD